ncbi:hypothetical protein D3C81_2080550 [compost metagenome]
MHDDLLAVMANFHAFAARVLFMHEAFYRRRQTDFQLQCIAVFVRVIIQMQERDKTGCEHQPM